MSLVDVVELVVEHLRIGDVFRLHVAIGARDESWSRDVVFALATKIGIRRPELHSMSKLRAHFVTRGRRCCECGATSRARAWRRRVQITLCHDCSSDPTCFLHAVTRRDLQERYGWSKYRVDRETMMWYHLLVPLMARHVPTYGGCVENCCEPPHAPTTSQVVYLRGSGGLELHLTPEAPLPARLDVDAVFRDPVDPSTYALYVGCGGCVASADPIVVDRLPVHGYQPAEVEPFTQTSYRSALSPSQRTFDTSLLDPPNCTEGHFTIRLVDFGNASASPIVWGAVVGLGESFTFSELLLFPVFILRNHGASWNELGFTYWIHLFVVAPALIWFVRVAVRASGCGSPLRPIVTGCNARTVREVCYEVALVGFVAAALEELTHLVYAQRDAPVGSGLWVGLFGVVGFAQGAGIAFVLIAWLGMRHPEWCTARREWAPLEFVTGVSFLFLLGAGFYVGPAGIVGASVARALS